MARQKKILVNDVRELLGQTKGNVAAIARTLGVTRRTVYNRILESPTLQDELKEARETMLDNAESVLYSKVLDGDMRALMFFLRTQGKDRGYYERREHTGNPDAPLIVVNWDDDPDEDTN